MGNPLELIKSLHRRIIFFLVLFTVIGQAKVSSVAETYPHYARRIREVKLEQIEVIDGDTFRVGRLSIRILGIDTPELKYPRYGIFYDQPYGRKAKLEAEKILNSARIIEYLPYRNDSYKRLLAHIFVDGKLFAVKMIEKSLAYETVSVYGDNGFPDLAREIKRAAKKAGKPPFMEPYRWRRINRGRK